MPVPTKGDSGFKRGTACLIILEPINALLASSFSKKGIKAAATETNCFGETSIKSILSLDLIIQNLNFFYKQLTLPSK